MLRKKILSSSLAVVMVLGSLTACGQPENEQKEVENSVVENQTSGEEKVEEEVYEPATVKILAQNVDGALDTWMDMPMGQVFIEKLEEIGIKLELELVAPDSFGDVLNTRMASGVDMPDLISSGWGKANEINNWGKSGLVYSLDELIEKYDTDNSIVGFLDEYSPGSWEVASTLEGDHYYFYYPWRSIDNVEKNTGETVVDVGIFTTYLRADWVEAVGEELKDVYTFDEYINLLKKFREEDANGNGEKDEIIALHPNDFGSGYAPYFGLNGQILCGYKAGDTAVSANIYNENFPEYIKLFQELYECGVYDTVALSTEQTELISMDRVSSYFGNISAEAGSNLLPGYNAEDLETKHYVSVIIDDDGDLSNGYPMIADPRGAGVYTRYFIPTGCENPEAVMRLMDYVYSLEYAEFTQFGLEGEDAGYTRDENGNIMRTNNTTDKGKSLNAIGISWATLPHMLVLPSIQDIKEFDSKDVPKHAYYNELNYLIRSELYDKAIENGTVVYRSTKYAAATEEEMAYINEKENILNTYMNELIIDLVLGRKSLDDLELYQKELEDLGLGKYIEIHQNRYDRLAVKYE